MGKHLGVAYNLRLPQELKDKIAESAKELNRSMNADIVARLEESFNNQSKNDIDFFITFLEHFIEGRAVDPTSTALFELIKAWKTQKKENHANN
jgi:hypothetical protein